MSRHHINSVLACAGACILMVLAPQARADTYTVNIVQDGSNVVATGSGSLSVSGTTDFGSAGEWVQANDSYLILGSGDNESYTGVSGPSNFGPGGLVAPSSTTGGEIGFGLSFNEYVVPAGYVAGTSLTSSSTWDNATLSSLGLTDGTYSYTLGSGDMFVIDIGATPTPEPATITLLLTGAGFLGLMMGMQKRKAHGLAQAV